MHFLIILIWWGRLAFINLKIINYDSKFTDRLTGKCSYVSYLLQKTYLMPSERWNIHQ